MSDLPEELDSSDCTFEYAVVGGPYDGSKVICPPGSPLPKQIWFEYDVPRQTMGGHLIDTGEKFHVYRPKGTPIEGTNIGYLEFVYSK